MPVSTTPSVALTLDTSGALRADLRLSAATDNDLVVLATSCPGVYAYQKRKAVAQMYQMRPPIQALQNGGAAIAFTPIVFNGSLFENDGLAEQTGTVVDAAAGRFAPIDVQGYYRVGVQWHSQSPQDYTPGTGSPRSLLQLAIRSISALQGFSVLRQIGTDVRPGDEPQPASISTYGKYPWTFAAHMTCSALWPLDRGATVEIGVRQLQNLIGVATGLETVSPTKPGLVSAWLYMVRPF